MHTSSNTQTFRQTLKLNLLSYPLFCVYNRQLTLPETYRQIRRSSSVIFKVISRKCERETHTERETETETERETDRQTDRDRETDRQTGRQADRQRQRETETEQIRLILHLSK